MNSNSWTIRKHLKKNSTKNHQLVMKRSYEFTKICLKTSTIWHEPGLKIQNLLVLRGTHQTPNPLEQTTGDGNTTGLQSLLWWLCHYQPSVWQTMNSHLGLSPMVLLDRLQIRCATRTCKPVDDADVSYRQPNSSLFSSDWFWFVPFICHCECYKPKPVTCEKWDTSLNLLCWRYAHSTITRNQLHWWKEYYKICS